MSVFLTDLTEKQLVAIGAIAVESAYAEATVDMLLSSLTKLNPDQLAVLLPGAMLNAKLDMLLGLGMPTLKSKKRKDEFKEIISGLKYWNSQRNIAIHGLWRNKNGGLRRIGDFLLQNPATGNSEVVHKKRSKQPTTLSASKLESIYKGIDESNSKLFVFFISPLMRVAARQAAAKSRTKPPP